ncbi:hypothetical protein NDU88_002543 [Pleurodeles waltl]|uniref:Uncharacterized protein n=1 Tax=Pleurodeles waltl TaxID=8319 RepID=A0AAV7TKX5_PLEWA|nr:hypothetical protein NDU88_002543 [Pleurodeles waltl]
MATSLPCAGLTPIAELGTLSHGKCLEASRRCGGPASGPKEALGTLGCRTQAVVFSGPKHNGTVKELPLGSTIASTIKQEGDGTKVPVLALGECQVLTEDTANNDDKYSKNFISKTFVDFMNETGSVKKDLKHSLFRSNCDHVKLGHGTISLESAQDE